MKDFETALKDVFAKCHKEFMRHYSCKGDSWQKLEFPELYKNFQNAAAQLASEDSDPDQDLHQCVDVINLAVMLHEHLRGFCHVR